jgi:hypothetical protein
LSEIPKRTHQRQFEFRQIDITRPEHSRGREREPVDEKESVKFQKHNG